MSKSLLSYFSLSLLYIYMCHSPTPQLLLSTTQTISQLSETEYVILLLSNHFHPLHRTVIMFVWSFYAFPSGYANLFLMTC